MRLYKRNAKGEPQFWDISELPNGNISLKYGLVAGTTVHDEEVAKKLVKGNEIESRIKAKRKEGYKEATIKKKKKPKKVTAAQLNAQARAKLISKLKINI